MDNNLLSKVKDDYAQANGYRDWDHYPITSTLNHDEVSQRYAEAYHAAKLAEVAQGECFTPKEAHDMYCDYANIPEYTRELLADKLNAKAAAFAAAKVEGIVKALNDLRVNVYAGMSLEDIETELVKIITYDADKK